MQAQPREGVCRSVHSCKRPPFCVTGSNWCLDKTGGDPTPFLTKENCICVEGICRLLLLKDFGWIFPTTSSCLHPLPGGVHIRALQQSTANISLSSSPILHIPPGGLRLGCPYPALCSPSSTVHSHRAPHHGADTEGLPHRGAAPWSPEDQRGLRHSPVSKQPQELWKTWDFMGCLALCLFYRWKSIWCLLSRTQSCPSTHPFCSVMC